MLTFMLMFLLMLMLVDAEVWSSTSMMIRGCLMVGLQPVDRIRSGNWQLNVILASQIVALMPIRQLPGDLNVNGTFNLGCEDLALKPNPKWSKFSRESSIWIIIIIIIESAVSSSRVLFHFVYMLGNDEPTTTTNLIKFYFVPWIVFYEKTRSSSIMMLNVGITINDHNQTASPWSHFGFKGCCSTSASATNMMILAKRSFKCPMASYYSPRVF